MSTFAIALTQLIGTALIGAALWFTLGPWATMLYAGILLVVGSLGVERAQLDR